ncbi:MAG: MbcA/ParS/Xre antitoxin family protein [Planctomycetota bacterium]
MTARKKKIQVDPAAVLSRALLRAAEELEFARRPLARVLGVSEATLSRLSAGRNIDPESKEGELARLFLRLYRSLDALVGGDREKARLWFQAENSHLNGRPEELVTKVEGLVRVIDYLDAMRGKF